MKTILIILSIAFLFLTIGLAGGSDAAKIANPRIALYGMFFFGMSIICGGLAVYCSEKNSK